MSGPENRKLRMYSASPRQIIPSSKHTRSGESSSSSVIPGCEIFKWMVGDVGMCALVQLLLFDFNLTPGEIGTS